MCSPGPKEERSYSLIFCGSVFEREAWFGNRHFGGKTDFGPLQISGEEQIKRTSFKQAPIFHGSKLHQDTNFDSAIFDTPNTPESARAFRTLKLAMEQLKAVREEQFFFRKEMEAERPSLPALKRGLSRLYKCFSDYGFSINRPLAWAVVFLMVFGGAHGLLANAWAAQVDCADEKEIKCATSCQRTSDLINYALANAAPVPGLDKMQTELRKPLFGEHGPIAVAAIILEILHKIVTLVMTFLFALGLRNLFKMKS